MAVRLAVLIDGFNFYHSLEALIQEGRLTTESKWINFWSLAEGFVHQIPLKGRKEVVSVDYFSAFARHKTPEDPFHVKRHETLIQANEAMGVSRHMHRFKKRHKTCKICGERFKTHEEKETDVAIAIKLLRVFVEDEADAVVLVSGDSDLVPAVKCVFEMFEGALICAAFPYKRNSKELLQLVGDRGGSFRIKSDAYARNRLPDFVRSKRGKILAIPDKWRIPRIGFSP